MRDIENCLEAVPNKLYHSGIRKKVPHSTLADANEQRDWRIYADFAQILIPEARKLNLQDSGFVLDLKNMVYALDSTTIDLCLSLFPWARFRAAKGAVKAHVLMDLRGSIPTFIKLTDGLCHDVNVLDTLPLESGAFYLMDRGYVDFERLYRFVTEGAFFVTRAKSNLSFKRVKAAIVDKNTGVRCDQTIVLAGVNSSKDYPAPLRRVKFWDTENKRHFVFLTNAFNISALMVAMLYKERWQVELFFYGKHIVMQSWSIRYIVNQCFTNKLYTTTLHNNITVEGLSTSLADPDFFPNHVSLPFQEQGPNTLFQVLPASA